MDMPGKVVPLLGNIKKFRAGMIRGAALIGILLLSMGIATAAHAAGWPREQVLMTGILCGTVFLWVTEMLPLFATAFLSITLQLLLLSNPGHWPWLGFQEGASPPLHDFLSAAADPVLLLFFSGFILARAMNTSGADRNIAAKVLGPMSGSPSRLLLAVILVTALFSPWMSNTATAALMLALIGPITVQIPSASPFRKALVLAIPLAANIGGMSTPIASPPNAIAVSYLAKEGIHVDFFDWILLTLPLVVFLLFLTWRLLLRFYPSDNAKWNLEFDRRPLGAQGIWVVSMAALTFVLWLTEPLHKIPAPVVSILPVTAFFIAGTITRKDVNTLDWDILILIGGGLTLGYGLQITGLDQRLLSFLPFKAGGAIVLASLGLATLCLGTFFSNTAIASMMVPMAMIAAKNAQGSPSATSFALTIALVASLTMALPVSTPPNAMAYAAGNLDIRDFVRMGGILAILGTAIIILCAAWIFPMLRG